MVLNFKNASGHTNAQKRVLSIWACAQRNGAQRRVKILQRCLIRMPIGRGKLFVMHCNKPKHFGYF